MTEEFKTVMLVSPLFLAVVWMMGYILVQEINEENWRLLASIFGVAAWYIFWSLI